MAFTDAMRQHKSMALGKGLVEGGNHGCSPLSSTTCGDKAHRDQGMSHTPMDDGSRAGPPHISRGGGKLPATAHSDHGPHNIPG
jgi:hypothetical protein